MSPRVIHTAQALVDVVVEVPDLPRRGGNSMATSVARYAGGATTILLAAVFAAAPFQPDPAAAEKRNAQRDGKHVVPPAGLFGTLKRLQRPTMDEGFDELYLVRTLEGSFAVERQA